MEYGLVSANDVRLAAVILWSPSRVVALAIFGIAEAREVCDGQPSFGLRRRVRRCCARDIVVFTLVCDEAMLQRVREPSRLAPG